VKDIATAVFFMLVGSFFLVNGLEYHTGTMAAMGPGFFPVAFSSIMIVLGIVILVRGIRGRH